MGCRCRDDAHHRIRGDRSVSVVTANHSNVGGYKARTLRASGPLITVAGSYTQTQVTRGTIVYDLYTFNVILTIWATLATTTYLLFSASAATVSAIAFGTEIT